VTGLLELYYQASERGSRKVLAFIEDHAMEEFVRLRDVEREEVRGEFQRRGGDVVPALWDSQRLHLGAEAVIARLIAFLNIGRSD
jgi:hypothetical protein